jgi:hypothetical protein
MAFLLTFAVIMQVNFVSPKNEVKIKIQTTKDETYCLLTRERPVEIEVEGPTWLRVYSRIFWPGDAKGVLVYKIILEEDDIREKFVSVETERSKVAKHGARKLSKWRSFYLNVPKGTKRYRFIYWRAPSDSVLLKFAYESPGKWKDIAPITYSAKLELAEDEKIIDYYEATAASPVVLEVEGPRKIKVISRVNFSMTTQVEQLYSVEAREKGKVIKNTSFRAHRSETTEYRDRSGIVPSNPGSFYLNIKKGKHRIEFSITGGESGALRFMVEEK